MAAGKKKTNVKLADLCFYFDAVERDRLECSGTSRKSGEILALRDRMLRLPDEQFDAALSALRSLVSGGTDEALQSEAKRGQRQGARDLYDVTRAQATGGRASTASKVSPT